MLWVCFWGALAYFEGQWLASFYGRFHQWTLIGLIAVLVLVAGVMIVYRFVRKRRHAA
jgi:membrane protein DedA with SNARE-associated domain